MKYSSFKFRFAHLYRKPSLLVVSCVLLLVAAPSIRAQKKNQGGPRAIAVVTWNGDSPTPAPHASVLTPVAILVEGRFYDANLYEAQPEPMTVDSGVVYDVLKNGDPIGTFTVGGVREKDDVWYGTGLFEPKGAMTVQMTKSGPKTTRSGQTVAASGKSNSDAPEDRPRLRRGTPPPPEPKSQTDAVLSTIDRDPERPTLRRHTADEIKSQQSAENAPPAAFVPPETHILPAVSDAGGPVPHSLIPHYKTGELLQIREDMEKLVRSELGKQRKQPEAPKKTTRQQHPHASTAAPQLELTNPKFGVFDVNGNNAPIVIYSATTMLDGAKKYITVGAWEEIDQSLRKVFSQVTDDAHLDVYPRLEIIDAVDARGNGRGELLFRAFGDQGNRFVLYHPGPDSLDLLFDSAKAESAR
jgi:hypothetical protein